MRLTKQQLQESLLLYAVTDRAWLAGRTLSECVEQALQGGTTFVQLREKNMLEDEMVVLARELKGVCARYQVPFVINDNIHVAKLVDADGVHVGQDDASCTKARLILGEDKIIGVSVATVEEALEAEREGADYLGVGALFATATKTDACLVSYNTLQAICAAVSIPVIGIGGLNESTIPKLAGSGIVGVALVSALFAANNIKTKTMILRSMVEKVVPDTNPSPHSNLPSCSHTSPHSNLSSRSHTSPHEVGSSHRHTG